ncbi:M6 family metalloprotease domain-containing protein [Acidaminobacter sp.]|uniref:M6 family metalloprotease domain-containing protein n=1 Tax=Acidaminobacter sp. TaxID=1872102 RepID=UPI002568A98F|nr:M6 family metalloprotease domain-containing protein [Acidaminobacter sp.]MDK9710671.1 immune inhibitor A [Acidaminobacter sp.]
MCLKKVGLLLLMAILVWGMMPAGYAVNDRDGNVEEGVEEAPKMDNKPDPLTTEQLELKGKAFEAKLSGKDAGNTVEVAKGQFVELAREGEGAIWTVLGEFADLAHNSMPEPDRAVDNTTIWVPDFSRDYYMDLLFDDAKGANSMRNYYIEQSSNRYTVHGDVTDWVEVPGNLVDYDDNPDSNVWYFLEDSVNSWYASQIAAGKTPAEINAYLSQFDVWDRYDYNGNGNFDEPDGYIDTFQSVHAGYGEEGGGAPTTIWSHSWYARYNLIGFDGPAFNLYGGIQIGDSDYWVGKYTVQPENGGVGVFAHEFGHDLGLPDLYDYYGENGTGFWTLMSSGSWMNDGLDDIGSKPSHMGAWEKFQLGWLNYEVARAGVKSVHRLGPMEFNTKQAQGLFVILPQKAVTSFIADPFAGSYFYFSGSANNLNNKMVKSFTLPVSATLNAKVNYGIEEDYDFAYLIISTDGGVNWSNVPTNLSNQPDFGFDGDSGGWVDLTADLSAYTGQVMIGFKYLSDGGVNYDGLMVDDITVSGDAATYGAELDEGWTMTGFRITTGTEDKFFNQYYVAEYRSYLGYDSVLKTGPYYFGYPTMPDFVDHFPYQDGLLIHYWDTAQADNNTGLHPGQGLLLPIDAHYQALKRVDNGIWRNRIQSYDSTFSISPTDGIPNIHHNGVLSPVPSLPGVKVFDDRITYYDPANPLGSVMNPNTGTMITVLQEPYLKVKNPQAPFMQIQVSPAK